MDPLDILPLETWREIAMIDRSVWFSLIRVIPGLYDGSDRTTMKVRAGYHSTVEGGVTSHYLDGRLHRDPKEGPACESELMREYYWMGRRHRDFREGPAFIFRGEVVRYYFEGKLHRPIEEGPAIEYDDGHRAYYVHGEKKEPPPTN